jgi:5-methyltetrahydropteroyltriglutamate--homocysteine methyltransferase
MSNRTTMTGSWFRTPEVLGLLARSPTGELGPSDEATYLAAERSAIRDQLHPGGASYGLDQVSPGEQRVSGYTTYLPSRFEGFSPTERVAMPFSPLLLAEFQDSNPALASQLATAREAFALPKIVGPLSYRGVESARRAARDAARLAHEEGAPGVFLPAPSPGVITIFYPNNPDVYPDHASYLNAVAAELAKEYRAILETPGVVLQIDAPDLAMGRQTATDWGVDFYQAVPQHVDAINRATEGLPRDRVRVHYCFGNYAASHASDADFARVLPELARLRASALVGELANPHHEGDLRVLQEYAKEHGWPHGLAFVGGVIDVKTPIVESPRTVRLRLDLLAKAVGPENAWGGTDCGFETFAHMNGVTRSVGLQKLRALAEGARLPAG